MSTDVDLRELAIDRGGTGQPSIKTRRHVLTRYVLPLILIVGFLSLVAWASRDLMFPPKPVPVVPVEPTPTVVERTPVYPTLLSEPVMEPISYYHLVGRSTVFDLLLLDDGPEEDGAGCYWPGRS